MCHSVERVCPKDIAIHTESGCLLEIPDIFLTKSLNRDSGMTNQERTSASETSALVCEHLDFAFCREIGRTWCSLLQSE